jgi:hypothetical protein
VGACATLRHRKGHHDALRLWASGMLERKTVKLSTPAAASHMLSLADGTLP